MLWHKICKNTIAVWNANLFQFTEHKKFSNYFFKLIKNYKYRTIMNIKPLADRVLVKPAPAEQKTVSGIIIPDSAKEKPLKGEVLAVGNGTKDEEMVVAVGNTVLYGKYAGTELEWEGEKLLIMRQSDILAII